MRVPPERSSWVALSPSSPQQRCRIAGQRLHAAQRVVAFCGWHGTQQLANQVGIKNRVLFLDALAAPSTRQGTATAIERVGTAPDISIPDQASHDDAHGRPANAHVLRQFVERGRPCWVQMIEYAGLVFGNGVPGRILAQVPAMAGNKNRWVGCEQSPYLRVQHSGEATRDGLIDQTKSLPARDDCGEHRDSRSSVMHLKKCMVILESRLSRIESKTS